MSDLPQGWEWATLGELAAPEDRAITDGPFGSNLKSAHYTDAGARVFRLQNIGNGVFRDERAYISLDHFDRLRAHEAREGDLLVASLGDDPPRACLVPRLDEPAIVKADCIRLRLASHVDARWVLYSLMSPITKQAAAGVIKGVGRPRLGLAQIRSIQVPVPPAAEQRRIVAALDDHLSRLDAGMTTLASATRRISIFEDQVVTSACSGGGGALSEPAPPPAPVGTNEGTLPSLPASWRWARLGEIADVVGGITKDAKRQLDSGLREVPYLRVANVQRGRLDMSEVTTIRAPEQKIADLALRPGDVLLNEGGDRDKLARGWIWQSEPFPVAC